MLKHLLNNKKEQKAAGKLQNEKNLLDYNLNTLPESDVSVPVLENVQESDGMIACIGKCTESDVSVLY